MQTPHSLGEVAVLAVVCVLSISIAGAGRPGVRGQAAADVVFQSRLAAYLSLREDLARIVHLPLEPTDENTAAAERQRLGRALRGARADVPQGNIFSGSVATLFRRLAAEGMRDDSVRIWIDRRALDAGRADRARVNGTFPIGAGHDVHPALLRTLTPVPRGIEYRVVHCDLVLWDVGANVVIDVLPAAFAGQTI